MSVCTSPHINSFFSWLRLRASLLHSYAIIPFPSVTTLGWDVYGQKGWDVPGYHTYWALCVVLEKYPNN